MRPYSRSTIGLLAATACGLASCQSPGASSPGRPDVAEVACAPAADSGSTAKVVTAAGAFAASLDDGQRAKLVNPLELQYAIRWSNYPAGLIRRNGVSFGEMTNVQAEKADALIAAAAGACGQSLFKLNRAADVIGQKSISAVNPGAHFVSFNGQPSTTQPWMLMFGGHHQAFNLTFNGPQPGATPLFAGSDPARFTDEDGVIREPLAEQSIAMAALAEVAARYAEAKLPGVYTDLTRSVLPVGAPPPPAGAAGGGPPAPIGLAAGGAGAPQPVGRPAAWGPPRTGGPPDMGPRGIDSRFPIQFPATPEPLGVSYSKLAPSEQAAVRRAIESYASLQGARMTAPLLRAYLTPDQLARTFIAYAGDPHLRELNAYARIDGPRVWIEISVQASLVDAKATHFHSVWRDKVADYGGNFRS